MKEIFENPTLEIIRLANQDVITASSDNQDMNMGEGVVDPGYDPFA